MNVELILREARESDIEAISEIARLSMSSDPAWTYRFQFAKDYPKSIKKIPAKDTTNIWQIKERAGSVS